VLAVIPFMEIIRNDLFANLVSVPEKWANNIDDLIDESYVTYIINHEIVEHLRDECNNSGIDVEFKNKIEELNRKASKIELTKILDFLTNPEQVRRISQVILLKDEISMPYVYETLDRISIHVKVGDELYLPKLVTPIFFAPNFQYIQLADNM